MEAIKIESLDAIATSAAKNAAIIACAGSGKTTLLAKRVSHLTTLGIPPKDISLVTFTNAAVEEIRQRIPDGLNSSSDIDSIQISTIHGLAKKIIDRFGDSERRHRQILSEPQKLLVVDQIIRPWSGAEVSIAERISELEKRQVKVPEAKALFSRWITDMIDFVRTDDLALKDISSNSPSTLRSLESYNNWLIANQCSDPINEVNEALALLGSIAPETLRSSFVNYLMVDEYQDVNQKQDALVRTFLEKGISVWVVGDDDQAIFDFQGGDCRYLTNISARDDVESYSLNTNFRCGRAINHIANDVGLKIPRVLDKQIISGSPLQGQVIVETFQSEPIMCQSVVHFIKNELGKIPDFKFSDVAVLDFSPEINLRELVKWFDIHQIPWKYRDNKYPLSDSPPVELLIGAIDWICRNPEVPKVNDKSNSPSKADLEENRHLDILFPQNNPQRKAAVKGLLALHKKFESWTSNAKNVRLESTESLRGDQPLSPEQFGARMFKVLEESHEMAVTSIIEELKIIFSFYQTGHNDSTYMEIEAFDEIVRDFSLICPNGGLHSFYRFLFQFAMGGGRGSKHKSLYFARRAQQYEGDAVLISSLHQAKGLTCEFVFIPRLNEGTQRYELPRLGPRIYDENPLFSKEFRLTTPRRTTPATDIRLFYVGVTRARKLLWLSGLTSKLKRGERQLCRPSRFLSLVKESCAEYKTQS